MGLRDAHYCLVYDREAVNSKPLQGSTLLRLQSLEKEAWAATEQAIDDLHFMAAAIHRSSVQSEKYNLSSRFERDDDLYFGEYATLLVKREFPNARRSLCEQLGASIAVRRKRLFRSKLHEKKLNTSRKMLSFGPNPSEQATGSVSKSDVSLSHADAQLTPQSPQRLKENNVPTRSEDTTSKLASVEARNYIRKKRSLSTISIGSSVQISPIDYPEAPKSSEGDIHCACPYCAKPLEAERLKKDNNYWE
jgi:hypothetical protein